MFSRIAAFGLTLLLAPLCHGQWATGVLEFGFGTNQTLGQSSAYFPANVLGAVTASASATAPAFLPQDVVSLGRNGYVVLSFDRPIIDGNGPDFIVFENAFAWGDGQVFEEWMTVAVSEDGTTWLPFPCDTLTGEGMAGRTPTFAATAWTDPAVCGGDAFDLATVGLAQVRYVKVQDATRYQSADRLSAELDAVAAIHQLTASDPATAIGLTLTQTNNLLEISTQQAGIFTLFGVDGRNIASVKISVNGNNSIPCPAELSFYQFVPVSGGVPVSGKIWGW